MKQSISVGFVLVALSMAGLAQSVAGLGAISGSVHDSSGAAIPGADVVVANEDRGIKRTVTTNEAGLFSAASLPPASGYTVSITKSGMTTFQSVNLDLQVGQNLSLAAVLQVAGTMIQIDVETPAPLVEQTRMDVSQVVSTSMIDRLPIWVSAGQKAVFNVTVTVLPSTLTPETSSEVPSM